MPADVLARLKPTLSADERDRASRFRFDPDREAFIAVRGSLRLLLARYLGRSAAGIVFEYGPRGKPHCPNQADIAFNLSSSGGIALFAFARGCEPGIDLERVRAIPELLDVAKRFFSPGEVAELAALPEDRRERVFFHCWTRQEARVKATGEGLATPEDGGCPWNLCNFDPAGGYAAALAYRGRRRRVVLSPFLAPARLLSDSGRKSLSFAPLN
ncbi:MAG: 4'-phosphopantetheinyl transferase family protein [Bryobacteraceae bacterium]